jgi:hypothetical protein
MSDAGNVLGRCRANEYYRRAVESPDLLAAVELRDEARAALLALQPSVSAPPQPTTPDADLGAFLAAVVAADDAQRAFGLQSAALQRLVNDCDSRIGSAGAVPDPILASLNEDLSALWERVGGAVDKLQGARTVREVLAADITKPWKELTALRDEYNQLRQAQEWTLAGRTTLRDAASQHVLDDHASLAFIRDLDDVFPSWNQPDRTVRISGDAPRRQPWPNDPVEQLVWLYDHAEVWIPTIVELDQHRRERYARLNPAGERRVQKIPAPATTTGSVYEGATWGELLGMQQDNAADDDVQELDDQPVDDEFDSDAMAFSPEGGR